MFMPRAVLVGRWAVSRSGTGCFAILGQPGSTPGDSWSWRGPPDLPAAKGPANPGTVRVTDASSDHLTIEAM